MKFRIAMLAASSLTVLASAAAAQAPGNAPTTSTNAETPPEATALAGADEIIVTARRREESLQDVPVTINAVTSEAIAKLNFRRFEEIQNLVPGLVLQSNSNGIGGTASVRGVNFDVNVSGNNGTIEFYFNDAPISAGNLFQATFDIGQVELLRGPQGTLRGRASPSGSITVTTHRADLQEIGGYASMTGTSIGGINANAAINIPVIKDVLAIRIAGVVDDNEQNRVHSVNYGINPYSHTNGGRITARFDPTDTLTFSATYQQIVQHLRTFDQVESVQELNPAAAASPVFIRATDRRAVEDAPRRAEQKFYNLNLQGQWAVAGQKLNYVGERNVQRFDSAQIDDMGDFFPANFPAFTKGYGLLTHYSRARTWAHELRLSNEERVAGIFDYIVGGFYQKGRFPTDLLNPTVVLFGLPSPTVNGLVVQTPIQRRAGSTEKSGFANLTAHLGDSTEISGGARYIDYKAFGRLLISGTLLPAANEDVKPHKVIYTGSVNHHFGRNLMLYGTVGSSFRPPVTSVGDFSVTRSAQERAFTVLPSETSTSYEVGAKAELMDNRLRLNVSAYRQDFKNNPYRSASGVFYVNQAQPNGPLTVANFNFIAAVPVRVQGLEGEFSFRASQHFDFGANAAYAHSKIRNGIVPCNDYFPHDGIPDTVATVPTVAQIQAAMGGSTIAGCPFDGRASLAAPFSGNVHAEYSQPLTDGLSGYVRGLGTYYGRSQNDPTNAVDDVRAYALLNLYAGIRAPDGAWELSFFGKNVTKTERVLSRTATPLTTPFNIGATGVTGTSTYYGITETQPREFGINLRYAFGSR